MGLLHRLLGRLGGPIVPDPARQAFLADLAGREGKDDGGRVRGVGLESHSILLEECHHSHESDALVSIDKSVIFRQPERVCGGKPRRFGLFIAPFIDGAFECRAQHAFIAQTGRASKAAQLPAMNCYCLIVSDPQGLFGVAHLALSSFCKRRERVPVLVHNTIGDFHGPLEVWIIRDRLESPAREFGDVQFLTTLEVEPLHQLAR